MKTEFFFLEFDVFFSSLSPTKSDMLAFRALETVPVDSERFPSVSTWKNMVQSFTEDSRKRYVFCFYYFFFRGTV